MTEYHKLSKNYKKAFDAVLQGSFAEALPVLIEYLNFLDQVSFEIDNYFLIIGNLFWSFWNVILTEEEKRRNRPEFAKKLAIPQIVVVLRNE